MGDCCASGASGGFDQVFNERFARRLARRYRRRGLPRAARHMVEFLAGQDIAGASVLEIGGGVGELQLELLQRGAASTTNLELSRAYESEALALAREAGMEQRVQRLLGIDLAVTPQVVAAADVVVLHRVVCCYRDADRLLAAAAGHARRLIVFSYPPDNWLARLGTRLLNGCCALLRQDYRSYAHDPAAMIAVLEGHGFAPIYQRSVGSWRITGALRG